MVSVPAPVYNPIIEIADLAAGVFNVESQTYPGVLYQYNTRTSACECMAGQKGRPCKHGLATRSFEQGIRHVVASSLHNPPRWRPPRRCPPTSRRPPR